MLKDKLRIALCRGGLFLGGAIVLSRNKRSDVAAGRSLAIGISA